jgi:hypothetical protein
MSDEQQKEDAGEWAKPFIPLIIIGWILLSVLFSLMATLYFRPEFFARLLDWSTMR